MPKNHSEDPKLPVVTLAALPKSIPSSAAWFSYDSLLLRPASTVDPMGRAPFHKQVSLHLQCVSRGLGRMPTILLRHCRFSRVESSLHSKEILMKHNQVSLKYLNTCSLMSGLYIQNSLSKWHCKFSFY